MFTEEQLAEAWQAYKQHETVADAARSLGLPRTTFRGRLAAARSKYEDKGFEVPVLPDGEVDVEDLIKMRKRVFLKKKEAKDARKWITIKMTSNEPVGLFWLGDPHVDDDGCDWITLEKHLDIIRDTPGLRGCSLGDASNNWVGRLARLYAQQSTSAKQAWMLVEWLIKEMNPLLLISGNHDIWSGAGDPIKWMKESKTLYEEWRANIELQFPNGRTCRVVVAHDLPGSSIWNELHAQFREAKMQGGAADLYISGHRHQWGLAQLELENNNVIWAARARGYKYHDAYALHKGKREQENGQAIVQVIDPEHEGINFVTCFADPETGTDYLKWRQGQRGK